MEAYEILVVAYLVLFIALLFTGYPIAWLLGGLSLLFVVTSIILYEHFDVDTFLLDSWRDYAIIVDRIWAQVQNWLLVALPLFIFMGLMLDRSGVAERMMSNFVTLLGRLRGGLALTVVLIGVLLAASTGIVGASVVLLAMLSLPLMAQNNYSKPLASGVVAASGTLGILIPPSIMLVVMSDQLSLSTSDLFMGALIPGLLLGLCYGVFVLAYAALRPDEAPAPRDAPPLTPKIVFNAIVAVIPAFGLIVAVLGTIFFGIATPTEAAGVGAFGATLLAIANRRFNLKVLREVCVQTTATTGFILAIFVGASAFSVVMRSLGGDEFIAHLLGSLPFGPHGVVLFILLIVFLAGFFLDWLEISLIILPLVAPVVKGLGFDLVWFTVLMAVCLQTSFLTPPVGFSLFYLKGVVPPAFSMQHIYRGVMPFVALQLLVLIVCFFRPEIITWLPRLIYGPS